MAATLCLMPAIILHGTVGAVVAGGGTVLTPEKDCHSQGEGYQEQDYEGRQVHGLHK